MNHVRCDCSVITTFSWSSAIKDDISISNYCKQQSLYYVSHILPAFLAIGLYMRHQSIGLFFFSIKILNSTYVCEMNLFIYRYPYR